MSAALESAGLLADLSAGLERAAAGGRRTLVSATVEVDAEDPAALVFASRLATDHWFCWEQPDREFALAALGTAHESISRGPQRFSEVARSCLELSGERVASGTRGAPPGTGPVWTGGFAFGDDGGGSPTWSSFPPAAMRLPEVSLCRVSGSTFLTSNAVWQPGRSAQELLERVEGRLAGLRQAPLPMLAPHRIGRPEVRSGRSPLEFERSVSAALERIGAGDLNKVVLAREVIVTSALRARSGGALRRGPRALSIVLLLLLRNAGGRLPRGLARAPAASLGGLCFDRRPRRLHQEKLGPGGGRPPRRAVAAEREGPTRSRRSSSAASSPRFARTRSGSRRRPSPGSSASPTFSTWRHR